MLNFSRWAIAAILLPLLIGVLCAVPSFLPDAAVAKLPGFMQTRVNLGLDLQGGVYLMMEINPDEVIANRLEVFAGDVRSALSNVAPSERIGHLPEISGPDCLRFIRQLHQRMTLLVLSDSVEPERLEELAGLGVQEKHILNRSSDPKIFRAWIDFSLGEAGLT